MNAKYLLITMVIVTYVCKFFVISSPGGEGKFPSVKCGLDCDCLLINREQKGKNDNFRAENMGRHQLT